MICNICKKDTILEKHHIQSKCYNGSNRAFNIIDICPICHKNVHYGLIIIEGWYYSFNGRIIVWRKYTEDSITEIEDPKVWLYKNHTKYKKSVNFK